MRTDTIRLRSWIASSTTGSRATVWWSLRGIWPGYSNTGLSLGPDRPMLEELIELGLARWFRLPRELPSRVMSSQLDRLVDEAKTLAWQSSQVFVGMDVVRYAKSNRLTVMQDGRIRLSPLAEVLQHLEGRDAVRWLLQVESQQALGQFDPDRLSREAALELLRIHSWNKNHSYDDSSDCPCALETADRLHGVGILHDCRDIR